MFNVNNKRYWHRSAVLIVNFEHILHLALVILLLTLNMQLLTGAKEKADLRLFQNNFLSADEYP